MPFSLKRCGAAGVAALFLLSGAEASAQAKKPAAPKPAPAQQPAQSAPPQGQPQPPQGPIKIDLTPVQDNWTKVCGKDQNTNKEICFTTRDFSAQKELPPLALAIYDIGGDETRIVRLVLPVGLMLRPGFRLSVDKGDTTDGNFEICFPNGCFAEARAKGASFAELKKGTTLNVDVKNQVNNTITFEFPLAGFGKAFDGPAIDPKVLEEQQKKLQEELQKRAEEERKRLEAAKAQSGGAALSNPAAPAPAPAPAPAQPKP